MVMPIVLIFFPVMTWIHWSRIMDVVALSVAAVFGLGGCILSLRHHRDFVPLYPGDHRPGAECHGTICVRRISVRFSRRRWSLAGR